MCHGVVDWFWKVQENVVNVSGSKCYVINICFGKIDLLVGKLTRSFPATLGCTSGLVITASM